MLNFHWLSRGEILEPKFFKKLNHDINFCGYKTWLTSYHSRNGDSLVKVANCIKNNENLKYIIPIRPYSISPEYFSMMMSTFEEISPHKVSVALLPGGIQDSENSLSLLIDDPVKFDTLEKRMISIRNWTEKFKKTYLFEEYPYFELFFAGNNKIIFNLAKDFNGYLICMYDVYKKNKLFLDKNKTIISISVSICETVEDYENCKKHIKNTPAEDWSIFGSKEFIIKKLLEIEQDGFLNVQLHGNVFDKKRHLIHEMVYELNFNKTMPKQSLQYDYTEDFNWNHE